jgi:phospholipid/cholesterol/gamma-HCH transport system permease protein
MHISQRIESLGASVVEVVGSLGEVALLALQSVYWLFAGGIRPIRRQVLEQLHEIGFHSLPMVAVTSLFTGMVVVVQVGKQFVDLKAEQFIGGTCGLTLTRELAPLVTAVVIAGRVGSALAASIGTMRVTEQLDALLVLSTEPVHYLVVPRVLACVVMVPLLSIYANVIGLVGGAFVAVLQIHITLDTFTRSIVEMVFVRDFVSGLLKAVLFGVTIAIIACYRGLTCEGGAEGVGRATTGAVVNIVTCLLIENYFLSVAFFGAGSSAAQ